MKHRTAIELSIDYLKNRYHQTHSNKLKHILSCDHIKREKEDIHNVLLGAQRLIDSQK